MKIWIKQRIIQFLLRKVTCIAIISEEGIQYSRWRCEQTYSIQNQGRTLKIFVEGYKT